MGIEAHGAAWRFVAQSIPWGGCLVAKTLQGDELCFISYTIASILIQKKSPTLICRRLFISVVHSAKYIIRNRCLINARVDPHNTGVAITSGK